MMAEHQLATRAARAMCLEERRAFLGQDNMSRLTGSLTDGNGAYQG
jgi:hypothetical protein